MTMSSRVSTISTLEQQWTCIEKSAEKLEVFSKFVAKDGEAVSTKLRYGRRSPSLNVVQPAEPQEHSDLYFSRAGPI